MADRPSARDDDRLPWLEPFGEGETRKARKPVSRSTLVGLLMAFFGVGLAVAFSLGFRVARPAAEVPASSAPRQPERTASVNIPLAPPVPLPKVELSPLEPDSGVPVAPGPAVAKAEPTKPVASTARITKATARNRAAKRQPILRPFVNIKRRPAPAPAPAAPPQPVVHAQPVIPFTPRGRAIQLGAYSTQKRADAAYRTLIWRYPYLKTKPKVIAPTRPVGGWRYYRLRLGTETQAQSAVICQQLQAKGQSCIVIY